MACVRLAAFRKVGHELGVWTQAQEQQAGGRRVQSSCMANGAHFQRAPGHLHYIMGRRPDGLDDRQHTGDTGRVCIAHYPKNAILRKVLQPKCREIRQHSFAQKKPGDR
jgi:hypothetical protein